jgi:preprotein translocase subunit SecF
VGTGTVAEAEAIAVKHGSKEPIVTQATSSSGSTFRVQTETLPEGQTEALAKDLASSFGVPFSSVSTQEVGPSWGGEITKKALTGLVVFLILIVLFLSLYFEWRMAVAALIALVHDLIITVGIYSLVGFTVTPATVIGVLTILGYSLYDTVVVFDKVKENTKGISAGARSTYSGAANLAMNQTLVRSINTSVIALLPVASILFIGPLLGATTLEDLALALFVGIASGTYSSIFIATPVLCQLKEREPGMQALAKRVAAREAAGKVAVGAGAGSGARSGAASGTVADLPDGDLGEADEAPAATPAGVSGGAGGQRPQPKRPQQGSAKKRPAGKKRR